MRFALLLFWVGAMAVPVLAQDWRDSFSLRLADPAFDWSGLYGGLHAAQGGGDLVGTGNGALAAGEMELRGPSLGVTLGANWQVEQVVFGLEGEMAWSGIGGQGEFLRGAACVTELGWLGGAKARAGLAMDRSLLFVTGGLALAGFRGTILPVAGAVGFDDHAWGWTIGLGSEVIVSENMSLRAEYGLVSLNPVLAAPGVADGVSVRPTIHVGRLGVIWHF